MDRRGFLTALAALPVAAVATIKSAPKPMVVAIPTPGPVSSLMTAHGRVFVTIDTKLYEITGHATSGL